jgi:hypothetical protein
MGAYPLIDLPTVLAKSDELTSAGPLWVNRPFKLGGQPFMFADPQSVTVNAVAQSMARISSKDTSSIYSKSDQTFKLTVSHTPSKDRVRSMARIDQRAVVTNPLDSTQSDYDTLSVYTVIDRPNYGFTTAQIEQLVTGFQAWLTTGNVDKLIGMES